MKCVYGCTVHCAYLAHLNTVFGYVTTTNDLTIGTAVRLMIVEKLIERFGYVIGHKIQSKNTNQHDIYNVINNNNDKRQCKSQQIHAIHNKMYANMK